MSKERKKQTEREKGEREKKKILPCSDGRSSMV